MSTVAVAIICKTPEPGRSKTRLSPPLKPEDCAALSACFIRDVTHTIAALAQAPDVSGHAVYTPAGSEAALRMLVPANFGLTLQAEGDFGVRLRHGLADLLAQGHAGAILVNSDSPTLPPAILRAAVDAVKARDQLVLSPASDGGYTLIGLSRIHERLFEDIPWSTEAVYRLTLERAAEIGLPVANVPPWYDVDEAETLALLADEMRGIAPPFAVPGTAAGEAPATRAFVQERLSAMLAPAL